MRALNESLMMQNGTERLNGLAKGTYSLPFLKTLVIYIRYCLSNMSENILKEYTSPDISLFKEKQKRPINYAEEHWPLAENL